MPRYFVEVAYKGTAYSGFQSQHNTPKTIQTEVEKAISTLFHLPFPAIDENQAVRLTSSSRTDTGVHALQNFFHFDYGGAVHEHFVYKMNAILPPDIVVKQLFPVHADAHCRFDAVSREYRYFIYRHKDPFLEDRAFFFPYKLNWEHMQQAAAVIKEYGDFTSFSKRNTQVKTFICNVQESEWVREKDCIVYHVKANRFLRGMVRALVATMLQVGRNKISISGLRQIIESRDCTKASFAVPGHGLFLTQVTIPYLPQP
jgi:tRNA pseudouridine38-40 synthase